MLSTSVLCPHIEQGSGLGWLQSLPVKPKAVKIFQAIHAREVKSVDPMIVTVYRRYVADQGSYMVQGYAGGQRFVQEIGDLAGVDYLEGLNECTSFDDETALRQANAFHLGFIDACVTRGVTPIVLNIAVGNPREDLAHLLAPCVQRAGEVVVRGGRGAVGYHGYGPARMLDGRQWLATRVFDKLIPIWRAAGVTAPIEVIYSEGGNDFCNTPMPSGPWKSLLGQRLPDGTIVTLDFIKAEHAAYAQALRAAGVLYTFLFTFWGTPGWDAYDYTTEPELMAWYRDHLVSQPAPVPPPPPEPPPPGLPQRVRVKIDGANIRSQPEIAPYTDVGDLRLGLELPVISKTGAWYHVKVSRANLYDLFLYVHETTVIPVYTTTDVGE